ncbi:50S ribosomal protein L24 [Candidatus Campbellbacteria bacterium CG11_big_fil_rev_8_21_14_0_20_44_21]|uniref:Large ribosomal subunit protein uL24 n=1 Tax=Candidatus Campbellbacteria bacterium CG22_combo_CG10-13_8_21_14_all_43_18 TaxID=1974530 RepID=A0A2H0DWI0_9BACT|nr:MAG: 50S ribosomal protein L24 [Candidatus Campbellbacteria bacterium CG22_combo_CG10-13_8_21_14_all_43_18]PIR24342.1 MAG: 50S ribosomal protein L24 [Candidatus Campbellbacteria bacterium CG11_big_fil_rev_8_21_14_0_20_44_21]
MRVKKGDSVKILTGKDRGKIARVLSVIPKKEKIIVEGVNLSKKHQKARKSGQSGQIIEKAMPVHISNVVLATSLKTKGKTKKLRKEN